ncbi:hypothetical protein ACFY2N_07505 [Streptomyces rubiginosohelvolus]
MKTEADELLVQELLADSELPFELPEAPVATQDAADAERTVHPVAAVSG